MNWGAVPRKGGVEFILFSRHATSVKLLLYDDADGEPVEEIHLEQERNRRGDLWYVFVPQLGPGQIYAYQVNGPHCPADGHRFNRHTVLLDPLAKALIHDGAHKDKARQSVTPQQPFAAKCVVVDDEFDWQGIRPPGYALSDTIIYETHVRGMTIHPSANVGAPGTYQGVIEKIPFFQQLGITALEFLPVQEFDHLEYPRTNPESGEQLGNYWGYSSIAFFAPCARYASGKKPGAQVHEFKKMVRELHRAGIEVILDVVFNHTAEGNHLGPTYHFKGIDNSIYYFLEADRRLYRDFSGCGNSMNSNHPVVRQMIRNCLRYWVTHMGVDGFRFDLASVLSRNRNGQLVSDPPLLDGIAEDPVLRDTKIIAEAWDAAGAYQVGSFPGGRWAEWNGKFRDDVRRFWRGDPGMVGSLATRLTGSSDLYKQSGRKPYHSINFITAHDGFTLNDLVSYSQKHNQANGEHNRDGDDHGYSFNCGIEGATRDSAVESLRVRQIKNLLATLLFSQGVPMILGGDEFRRTQQGNNNAYCQDNEISWYDWRLLELHDDVFRFCREVIGFRRRHRIFCRTEFFSGQRQGADSVADVSWYAVNGGPFDWSNTDATLTCLMSGNRGMIGPDIEDDDVLLLFNAGTEPVTFHLPAGNLPIRPWRLFLDTGQPAPNDIFPDGDGRLVRPGSRYQLCDRSMVCFHRPQC